MRLPKFLLSSKDLEVYFIHAPPQMPACKFETGKYLSDLIPLIRPADKAQLLIGDFNAVPGQACVSQFKELGFEDTHDVLSNLPQGTFGPFTWFPKILKLDHVLHNKHLIPLQIARFTIASSDHSGWIADYVLSLDRFSQKTLRTNSDAIPPGFRH